MDYSVFYTRDVKLTKKFLRKHYPNLKNDEDIIAMCIAKLWEKRPGYKPEKGMYSTYAFYWMRHVISEYNKRKYAQKRMAEVISAHSEIGEDITILDTISEEPPNEILVMLAEVVGKISNQHENLRKTIGHYMRGLTQKEISIAIDLPETHINFQLRKFRNLCKKEMQFLLTEP